MRLKNKILTYFLEKKSEKKHGKKKLRKKEIYKKWRLRTTIFCSVTSIRYNLKRTEVSKRKLSLKQVKGGLKGSNNIDK